MALARIDWIVLAAYFALSLAIGLYFARRAGQGVEEFFLAGRTLPWWLLGTSMVATTFSTDTPNLVTEIVRRDGLAGNWVWWAFLLSGMLTVFVFAPLWRRSGLLTDLELYEIRYSGRSAAFLRVFRAVYLGVVYNVIIIASVTLAATKIGGALFGASKLGTILVCAVLAATYSVAAGFWGVVVTDLFQFVLSLLGAVFAAVYALAHPQVGGLEGLVPQVADRLALVPPPAETELFLTLFVVPVGLQWWSVWYPGAEPGGGGYTAQRMLAARDERHALGGTLWFNVAHYALRPWPWILVALCSLVVYPDLASVRDALPGLDPALVGDDLAYPLMLRLLPAGLLGMIVASLAGAYMSTVDTHLNWGASYLVNDVYRRFVRPEAPARHYVALGRLATVVLVVLAGAATLVLDTARATFDLILQIGAGTGPLFILRWVWWRINAWSEIVAMAVSFLFAVGLAAARRSGLELGSNAGLVLGVAVTTAAWLVATLVTPPTDEGRLEGFCRRVRPPGPGWGRIYARLGRRPPLVRSQLWAWPVACAVVYATLFGLGGLLLGRPGTAAVAGIVFVTLVPVLVVLARGALAEAAAADTGG